MKKKTRYRLKNNLTVPFWIAFLFCLIGATVSLELFYKSFSRALTKMHEEPVAEITFKYKTAQRKFLDRTVWDRLRQHSPVYNGDTIHTAALSEATIWFPDGNVMDLAENTMAQIFVNQDKSLLADLIDGEAYIDASTSENAVVLSSKGVEVTVDSGSSVTAKSDKTENTVSLSVNSGNVTMNDGKVISKGESLAIENGKADVPLLSVFSPRPNSKIMYHHDGKEEVLFTWKTENAGDENPLKLIVAADKNFETIMAEHDLSKETSMKIPLSAGTYYWKMFLESGENSSGKFQVIQSLPPVLVAPVEDYDFTFRTRNPAVRFIWSESPYATSYKLSIYDSQKMAKAVLEERVSSASAIISSLKEGQWWWKVEPYYTINKEGYSGESSAGHFSITKKGNLVSPDLFVPGENALVNSASESGIIPFSWKNDSEAVSYRIKISRNENLSNPLVDKKLVENVFKLETKNYSIREGKYYWTVFVEDSEGNTSPVQNARCFYAMKGNPEQHLVEPASGYHVSQSLLQDTRFSWKKNLGDIWTTEFQVASDRSFNKIVYSDKTGNSSVTIPYLSVGTYWWRVVSNNSLNDAVLTTQERQFSVVGNLGSAKLVLPETRAVARETVPYEFKWTEVEGADFYKFTVYHAGSGKIVHEDNVYDTSVKVDMFNPPVWKDKEFYRFEVLAKSVAIPGTSSRRTGSVAERTFQLVKLKPVEIVAPKKNSVIDGIQAVLNPSTATWHTVDEVEYAQFVLSKVEGKNRRAVLKVPTDAQMNSGIKIAPKDVLLDTAEGLRPGKYEIVVNAKTLDGIDISNSDEKNKGYFSISKVDPLPESKGLSAVPQVFDAAYLSNIENPRTITLSWNPVKNATDYVLAVRLTGKNGKEILRKCLGETQYQFDFKSLSEEDKRLLQNGKFKWTVEALRRIDTNKDGVPDKILQSGLEATSTFETNVPLPRKTKTKGAAMPYAKSKK